VIRLAARQLLPEDPYKPKIEEVENHAFLKKLLCCFFCWKVVPSLEEELGRADVVLGQSFGLRKTSPGDSNKALAKIAKRLHKKYELPLILQWEIADCLPKLSKAGIIREHRVKGKYLDTYEALSQAKAICDRYGWKKAVILAHPHHYWRCVMIAKKLGFITVAIDTYRVPYDMLSIQKWTKTSLRFIPYDFAARINHLFRGLI